MERNYLLKQSMSFDDPFRNSPQNSCAFFLLLFILKAKNETLFIAILYKYHEFHNTVNKIASIERIQVDSWEIAINRV